MPGTAAASPVDVLADAATVLRHLRLPAAFTATEPAGRFLASRELLAVVLQGAADDWATNPEAHPADEHETALLNLARHLTGTEN